MQVQSHSSLLYKVKTDEMPYTQFKTIHREGSYIFRNGHIGPAAIWIMENSLEQFGKSQLIRVKTLMEGPLQQRVPSPFKEQPAVLFNGFDSSHEHYPIQRLQ